MTILEQRFYETVPSCLNTIGAELKSINESLSKLIQDLERADNKMVSEVLRDSNLPDSPITNSTIAADLMRRKLGNLDHEEFWVAFLGKDLRPKRLKMICCGDISSTTMDTRRVVKEALETNSTSVLVFHNHPSGNVLPSGEDTRLTESLKRSLDLFGILLVDHIIIGDGTFYSFADEKSTKSKK